MTATPLNTRVDDVLKKSLERIAKQRGKSLSQLVETILTDWLVAQKREAGK
jgi:predicted HicB family RNase H-like nuclease